MPKGVHLLFLSPVDRGQDSEGSMYSTSISLFLILASLASTSLGLHHLVITARSSLGIILSRQVTSGLCLSTCQDIQSTVSSCSAISCLCTAPVAMNLQACVNCAIATAPTIGVVSSAQSLIDTFESVCSTVTGLPSVTIATSTVPSTPNTSTLSRSLTSIGFAMTTIILIPTTISQVVIGPSLTPSATTSASNAGISGLPLTNSASSSGVVLHWTGALLWMAVGCLLVF